MKSVTTTDAYISLKLNGSPRIGSTNIGSSGSYQSSSIHATLKLKVGDEITIVLEAGIMDSILYDEGNFKAHFTGMLVNEDLILAKRQ